MTEKSKMVLSYLKVPAGILADPDLQGAKWGSAKFIWAWIEYHDKLGTKKGCWTSNAAMFTWLSMSEETLRKNLRILEALNKIYRVGHGRNRVYYSNFQTENSKNNTEALHYSGKKTSKTNTEEQGLVKINTEDLHYSGKKIDKTNTEEQKLIQRNRANSTEEQTDNTEELYQYNKDNKRDNKKDNNTLLTSTVNKPASDVKKDKQPTCSKKKEDLKVYTKKEIPYTLSLYLLTLITEWRPAYDKTRLKDDFYREKKLQGWSRAVDLMIRIDGRDPHIIQKVMEWAQTDRFWRKNILSTNKLRIQFDRLQMDMEDDIPQKESKIQKQIKKDPLPELTKKFIAAHAKFCPKGWEPSAAAYGKFILTTERAMKQVDKLQEGWVQDNLVADIRDALKLRYSDKGEPISPGHWCSDYTWDTLVFQYLVNQGVNPGNIFSYDKSGDKFFENAEKEEKQLSKSIQRSVARSDKKNKSKSGCPEFDYLDNI